MGYTAAGDDVPADIAHVARPFRQTDGTAGRRVPAARGKAGQPRPVSEADTR